MYAITDSEKAELLQKRLEKTLRNNISSPIEQEISLAYQRMPQLKNRSIEYTTPENFQNYIKKF